MSMSNSFSLHRLLWLCRPSCSSSSSLFLHPMMTRRTLHMFCGSKTSRGCVGRSFRGDIRRDGSLCNVRSGRRNVSSLKPNVLKNDPYLPLNVGLITALMIGALSVYKSYKKTIMEDEEVKIVRTELIDALHDNHKKSLEQNKISDLIAPTLIKLCWGAASTYSRHDLMGGVNGATMRFSPEKDFEANRGLERARAFLEPIKQRHPSLSYSDLWTLAAVLAIESLGGPVIPWVSGRTDLDGPKPEVTESRCPVADSGSIDNDIDHLKVLFGRIGGLTYKHIVALFGAHGVGRCHESASGFSGSSTRHEANFSNEYFKILLEEKWKVDVSKNNGKRIFRNEDKSLIMLPVDMALLADPEFHEWVVFYAAHENEFRADFTDAFSTLINAGAEASTIKKGYISRILGF